MRRRLWGRECIVCIIMMINKLKFARLEEVFAFLENNLYPFERIRVQIVQMSYDYHMIFIGPLNNITTFGNTPGLICGILRKLRRISRHNSYPYQVSAKSLKQKCGNFKPSKFNPKNLLKF